MAVRVFHQAGLLTVAAGYESGHTALFRRNTQDGKWERLYACQPHTQPGNVARFCTSLIGYPRYFPGGSLRSRFS